jgi:CHAD domain-containing protein
MKTFVPRAFTLTPEQRRQLEIRLSRLEGEPLNPLRRRLLALLLYDRGKRTSEVAVEAGLSRSRARYWRRQFTERGMALFPESPLRRAADGGSQESPASGDSGEIFPVPHDCGPGLVAGQEEQETLKPAPGGQGAPEASVRSPAALPFPAPLPRAGVSSQDSMAEAGRKIMLFHFAEMLRHEEGTRLGADIEELHDMRVATRRLRAAFDIFTEAFDPKTIKKHLKGLRAAGRALGRVRDLDVFIEKARQYLDSLPPEQRSGLDPLVATWTEQREAARAGMLVYLDSAEYAAFKAKFNGFVQTPGKGVRVPEGTSPAPGLVREAAPVLIYTRLAAVRAYAPLLSNASLEQLHALRIEFKKLRYAVEFFREALGGEAKAVIGTLKAMQDHLGDLNDARVACGLLSEFLSNWEQCQSSLPITARQNPAGIAAYLAAKHAELHRLMVTFSETWEGFEGEDFKRNLALAVAGL